jgi:hypothetical protein
MKLLADITILALEGKMASALIMHVREVGGNHEVGKVFGLCRGIVVTRLEGVLIYNRAEAIGGLLTQLKED